MRREHGCLSIESKDRAIDIWLFREHADVIRQIARGEIIRTINDNIVTRNNFKSVLAGEATVVRFDFDARIHIAQAIARGFQFLATDVFRAVQNLPLQIAKIDLVEINQTKFTDAGGGEIKSGR